jgi:hypothetical protein
MKRRSPPRKPKKTPRRAAAVPAPAGRHRAGLAEPAEAAAYEAGADARGRLRDIIAALRNASDFANAPKLADRLLYLVDVAAEEEPDVVPSAESLTRMIGFLRRTPSLDHPAVVLTPEGDFRAQWRKSPEQHFSVTFRPDGIVIFVVFAADRDRPGAVDRVSGTTSVDGLMAKVQPYDVLRWASA